MTEAAAISEVSFEKFLNGDEADKRAVAAEVFDAFSTVGWVYIKDHGIPQSRVDEIFRLVRPKPRASQTVVNDTDSCRRKPSSRCLSNRSSGGD